MQFLPTLQNGVSWRNRADDAFLKADKTAQSIRSPCVVDRTPADIERPSGIDFFEAELS
jgi:hypothetical protein